MDYEIPIYGYNHSNKINYHDNLKTLMDDDQYSGEGVIFQYTYLIKEAVVEPMLNDFGYEIKEHFSNGTSITMCGDVIQNVLADILCDIFNGYVNRAKLIIYKLDMTLIETTIVNL